jgi:ABC-type transport system involved in multi-copper enzyme maturation permease subunit
MVGAILRQELLLGGRRFQLHAFRWVYAGWLVLVVLWLFLVFLFEESAVALTRRAGGPDASAPEVVGARFAEFFVWQQALFAFLAVPVFTAGAIIDEKRQGTLQYLLLSEIEPRHILLGKLAGRLVQTGLWLLAGLPLFALLAGFGGVEPVTLLVLAVGLAVPLFAVAAATLLASVWCRQTRDAVVAVYSLLVAGWLGTKLGGPLVYLDPLWVLEPAWGAAGSLDLPEAFRRLGASCAAYAGLGAACLLAAALTLERAYRREVEDVRRERLRWYSVEREPIDDEPIRWREQHVEGLALNATFRRIPHWLAIVAVAASATASSLLILHSSLAPGAGVVDVLQALMQLNVRKVAALMPGASGGFVLQGVVVMLLASLIVGVRCAGALTQERERGTWEAVLLTPLSAKQIVQGKLWGILRASAWYLLAYAAPAVTFSALGGPLALTNTLAWLAATLLAMYFIGAAGLWCSARAKSSWRALLQTVGFGYGAGLAIAGAVGSVIGFGVLVVLLLLTLGIDYLLGTGFAMLCVRSSAYFLRVFNLAAAVGLVVTFWWLARYFVKNAQRWIADRERTRHQYDEPVYRRSVAAPIADAEAV